VVVGQPGKDGEPGTPGSPVAPKGTNWAFMVVLGLGIAALIYYKAKLVKP